MGDVTHFFSNAKVMVSCSHKTEQGGISRDGEKIL